MSGAPSSNARRSWTAKAGTSLSSMLAERLHSSGGVGASVNDRFGSNAVLSGPSASGQTEPPKLSCWRSTAVGGNRTSEAHKPFFTGDHLDQTNAIPSRRKPLYGRLIGLLIIFV